ncbi:hypothetical protein ASA1KI_36640 [Opitutales bacterium ASA1]|nr:hypothetical protein ASA1KI_36640 [Opitutales bacterium ASA1]
MSVVLFLFASLATATPAQPPQRQLSATVYRSAPSDTAALSYRLHTCSLVDATGSHELGNSELQSTRRALAGSGMHEAADGEPADVEIEVSVSVFGRMQPATDAHVRFRPVTHRVREVTVLQEGEDGTVIRGRGRAIVPANHGYNRASPPIARKAIFDKTLHLSARRASTDSGASSGRELWRVEVRNADACASPSEFMPFMLSAAMDALQRGDSRRVDLVLRADDPRVLGLVGDS